MPKRIRGRIFLIVFTTLLLLAVILLSSIPGSPLNFITSPLSAVLEPVQNGLNRIGDRISGFYQALTEGMAIRDRNQELLLENAELLNRITQLEEAGRQYEQLKEAFSLKDKFDQYEIIGSRILTREIGSWFDVIRIDAGTRDGISVSETSSFAVVNAQSQLVGRVLSADLVSGKVLPLLHQGFTVSGKINAVNGALLRVRGDLDLKLRGLCLVDQIPANTVLQVGDEIITSGSGGLFPAGIPIGRIAAIIDQDERNQRQAYLQPYADLESLSTVFILIGDDT